MNTLMHRLLLLVCTCILAPCAQAYYEPGSGRFLSPDPFGHEASMSLYDYAGGDPVNDLDPDGRLVAKQAGMSIRMHESMLQDGVDMVAGASQLSAIARALQNPFLIPGLGETLGGIGQVRDEANAAITSGADRLGNAIGADIYSDEAAYVGAGTHVATAIASVVAPVAAEAKAAGGLGNLWGNVTKGLSGFLTGVFGGGGVKPPPIPATPPPLPSVAAQGGPMFSSELGSAGPRASAELLDAMRAHGRTVTIAGEGSEGLRFLNAMGAEASVGGPGHLNILLRQNPSRAAAMEEFLHGTQDRLGIVDRLGMPGAENHVTDFMRRHSKLLGLEP